MIFPNFLVLCKKIYAAYLLFVILALMVLYVASLRIDYGGQGYLSAALILCLLLIRNLTRSGYWRIVFLALSAFIVLRYFVWRSLYTIEYQELFSFIGSIVLFAAELYGGLMYFLSIFVNIRPLRRQAKPLPADSTFWPTVDVLIPTYNEPVELVKITLAAASNIDYPPEKLNIYLLDDGATQQKLHAEDFITRSQAQLRRNAFLGLCEQLGIHYLSRDDNTMAKAGNLNAALEHVGGDLILVLDADHAPAVDILQKTAGAFIDDEKLFLVQTPHFFINPDPLEKNLNLFNRMPSENLMFYGAIQLGLDFWQSSFFCGSAAVLRRTAIDQTGGFKGKTITEDSETALLLHSKGWCSQYLSQPLISGLQPETFNSFIIQRVRWAQGMVQNFIYHNPLRLPGLKIWQRLGYLSNMLFWFFPFARVVYLLSPGLYLFFRLKIYNANLTEFFSYTVPYLLALTLTNHYLFSRVRWIFLSEIYEILQSLFSLRAVWAVLKNPEKPKFAVTPKMETLEEDFISPLAKPFYWLVALVFLQVIFGIFRCFQYPEEQPLIAITMFWAGFNLLLLLAVLGVLFEQKQRRHNPRIPVEISAELHPDTPAGELEKAHEVVIHDLSTTGGKLSTLEALPSVHTGWLWVRHDDFAQNQPFRVEWVNHQQEQRGHSYGIRFVSSSIAEYRRVVRFVHGDSERWQWLVNSAGQDPGLLKTIVFMIKTGVYHGLVHIRLLFTSTTKRKDYA